MGRPLRADLGGYVYHALNRANARLPFCRSDADFLALERVLAEALTHVPGMRLLAYCLMPNHWHLLLWPTRDGELADFMHWLTLTHTQRWHAQKGNVGSGHLYQGRYKSFPVEDDDHFYTVCRYVERNALRAGLAQAAEAWRWGSLWWSLHAAPEGVPALSRWPVPKPRDWVRRVNEPQSEAELEALRRSVRRGQPFGSADWTLRAASALGLASTLLPRGRPRKEIDKGSQHLFSGS